MKTSITPPRGTPLLLVALTLALAACGETSSYELRWTIDCKGSAAAACEPRSVKGCSQFGLDSIQVDATMGADLYTAVFPCYTIGEGPVGRGPDMSAGAATLAVTGLSPAGIALFSPVSVNAVIPDTGLVPVEVDLPAPAQCGDGVDNDGDGLVDLLDPDCVDAADTDEAS